MTSINQSPRASAFRQVGAVGTDGFAGFGGLICRAARRSSVPSNRGRLGIERPPGSKFPAATASINFSSLVATLMVQRGAQKTMGLLGVVPIWRRELEQPHDGTPAALKPLIKGGADPDGWRVRRTEEGQERPRRGAYGRIGGRAWPGLAQIRDMGLDPSGDCRHSAGRRSR